MLCDPPEIELYTVGGLELRDGSLKLDVLAFDAVSRRLELDLIYFRLIGEGIVFSSKTGDLKNRFSGLSLQTSFDTIGPPFRMEMIAFCIRVTSLHVFLWTFHLISPSLKVVLVGSRSGRRCNNLGLLQMIIDFVIPDVTEIR